MTDHWASHGYVVVQPEHPDSPTSLTRFSARAGANLHYVRISDVTRVREALFAPGDHYLGGLICRDDRGGPENRGGAPDRDGQMILAGVTTVLVNGVDPGGVAFLDAWMNKDPSAMRFLEEFDQHAGITGGRARFARK